MKEKAPRNRTLTLTDDEKKVLRKDAISLSSPCDPETIRDQIINQDIFTCIDFSRTISLTCWSSTHPTI